MNFEVPVVDITSWVTQGTDEERAAAAAELDRACREVGFVQVLGHGVPRALIADLTSAVDDFFLQELEVKKRSMTPPHINRGYSPPKSESLSLSLGVANGSQMNDFFESYNVGLTLADYPDRTLPEVDYQDNVWPELPAFQARVMPFFHEARRVAEVLTSMFPAALGLPAGWFDEATTCATATMRMNNYALPPGSVELDGDLRGMGEHTDFGIVTVLWADQVKGLQVLGRDGVWHDVSPADDALLVNLGDNMAAWTNDRWMSTLHRVRPPIVDGTVERRRSVAYFHGGRPDVVVKPIAELLEPGEEPLYYPITIAEQTKAKLAGSRGGVINPNAGREAARVLSARD